MTESAEDAMTTARIDVNDLERLAKERPDERFLRGSGILKLTGAIRMYEAKIRALSSEVAELRKDAERLDWLFANCRIVYCGPATASIQLSTTRTHWAMAKAAIQPS